MPDFNVNNDGQQSTNPNYQLIGKDTSIPLPPHQFQIPLNSLFTSVFGIAGTSIRKFKVRDNKETPPKMDYIVNAQEVDTTEETIPNYLGTPVSFWMKFLEGQYQKREDGNMVAKNMDLYTLPFSSVATFSRQKRFTETYMSGQKGSVIEDYGFEPWDIRIQGFILNNSQEGTIEHQVRIIESWMELSDGIAVGGTVFGWLGINEIALIKTEYLPSRTMNLQSILPFEITARSNEKIMLVL